MNGASPQSLTLLVDVTDMETCAHELSQNTLALQAGWSRMAEIRTACFALLPPASAAPSALFFECTFEGNLTGLGLALWRELGAPISAVLRHCEGKPKLEDAAALTEFLRARARRATALPPGSSAARTLERPQQGPVRRGMLGLSAACAAWLPKLEPASPVEPAVLEARRAAVGWQESEPGVPLVHVAELLAPTRARARLKRALQAIEGAAPSDRSFARFLLGRERLVFVAYPKERAAPFSERLTRELALPLARIWAQTRGAPPFGPFLRQRLRAWRVERFLLGSRVAVAVWFNAG